MPETGSEQLDEITERRLVDQSRRGDVAAFNKLVCVYQNCVYNFIYRLVSEPQLAADITQDVFLSAFQGLSTFRGSSLHGWLNRIAGNAVCDYWRLARVQREHSLESLQESSSSGFMPESKASENPESTAMNNELKALIQQGLSLLPEEQRLALVLRDIQGYSYDEIAGITSTTIGTVKSRIARGRDSLRQFLQQYMELSPPPERHIDSDKW